VISPSPLAGEGGARAAGVGGRGGVPTRQDLLARAKWMRANPTEAEKRLWSMLRNKRFTGFKFKRQMVIAPYIVDFVCLERRLILEADGSQHAESDYDARRDAFLRAEGFVLLRFWNNDILRNTSAVFDAIHAALCPPHPSATAWLPPSPARGEG
jgi:very-short-patch-repair endonuclease